MKAVRIWLLVLLAVLLPAQGAVAAAMLCGVCGIGPQSAPRMHERPAGNAVMDHGMAHDDADRQHDYAGASFHNDSQGYCAPDECTICLACCLLIPIASDIPRLAEPLELASVKHPVISSPAPSRPRSLCAAEST